VHLTAAVASAGLRPVGVRASARVGARQAAAGSFQLAEEKEES
jgi:hypothetical protein